MSFVNFKVNLEQLWHKPYFGRLPIHLLSTVFNRSTALMKTDLAELNEMMN